MDARRGRAALLVGLRDRAGGRGARPARVLQRVRADRDRARRRRRCSTPARRSSARSGASRPGRTATSRTGRGRSTSTCCCSGDMTYASERLTLPHREVTSRRFVLVPLLELDPRLEVPGHGRAADALAALTARTSAAPARRWRWARRCCSSSTSATRRRTSAPTRDRARPRLALRHRARVDRRRAGRRADAPCWRCAASASPTSTPRSSPPPSPRCGRSGRRWRTATSATRCCWSARA